MKLFGDAEFLAKKAVREEEQTSRADINIGKIEIRTRSMIIRPPSSVVRLDATNAPMSNTRSGGMKLSGLSISSPASPTR